MKLEAIRLKNFKVFKDVEIKNIPDFFVVVGANGVGKSTLFELFQFLQTALKDGVNTALHQLGGERGFDEVRSRNSRGPIEIELMYKEKPKSSMATYSIELDKDKKTKRAYVKKEFLKYNWRHKGSGRYSHWIDFKKGKGTYVKNQLAVIKAKKRKEKLLRSEIIDLDSNDLLAVGALERSKKYPVTVALRNLINNWHVLDLHVDKIRPEQEGGSASQLSRSGDNLALVVQYLYHNHKDIFKEIIEEFKKCVPGVEYVKTKVTEEGRILLKINNAAFKDPFLIRYISDGTIRMLAYLVLLYAPKVYPLLCIEEPENQLYPGLLQRLAEQFRSYASKGNQILVSTHSPEFLNAARKEEVFFLKKNKGYTSIDHAAEDEEICSQIKEGAKLGELWTEGWFKGVGP